MIFYNEAQKRLWNKIPEKIKTPMSIVVVLLMCIGIWFGFLKDVVDSDVESNMGNNLEVKGDIIGSSISQTYTNNPPIHVPRIVKKKILSSEYVDRFPFKGYATTYKIDISEALIPKLTLYTQNETSVGWWVQHQGESTAPYNCCSTSTIIYNAFGSYLISTLSTDKKEYNLDYLK